MEVIVAVSGLVVIALIAAVALKRKPAPVAEQAPVAAQPSLTAAEIREVIREIHGETLRDLAEQAKDDRQDAVPRQGRRTGICPCQVR